MKNTFIFIALFIMTMSVSFAQQCMSKAPSAFNTVLALSKDSMSVACLDTKEKYKCDDLNKEFAEDLKEGLAECRKKPKAEMARCEFDVQEESANNRKKIIQCDVKALNENGISDMGISECVFNGFKMSYDQLVNLKDLPEKIMESVVKGFHETQACNQSVEKKRELLNAFNLSVPDSRYKLSEHFLGRWLEDASCAEIDKQLFARYQNYQDNLMRERKIAIDTGRKPPPIKEGEKGPDIIKLVKQVMDQAQVKYECYTPKAKAEMMCTAVTSIFLDSVMGLGLKSAVTKVAALVRSKKALGAVSRAVAAGEKADLKDAGKLLNGDRKKAAGLLLKREISDAQEKAIIEAHEIGLKEGRGFFEYTTDDLRKKAKILKDAGFKPEEIDQLMRNGITGQFSSVEAKKAATAALEKRIKETPSLKERERMISQMNKQIDDFASTKDPAVAANLARLLGETVQSSDAKAARGFFQAGLDRVKGVAEKDQSYFKLTKTLENYLELASKAGDQTAVKKGMSEYVKQQYASEARRMGWKSTADAANSMFDVLEDEVAHYRKLGDKGALGLEAARRKQKALLEEFKFIDQSGTRARSVARDIQE